MSYRDFMSNRGDGQVKFSIIVHKGSEQVYFGSFAPHLKPCTSSDFRDALYSVTDSCFNHFFCNGVNDLVGLKDGS